MRKIFHLPFWAVFLLTIVSILCFIPVVEYDGAYPFIQYVFYTFFSYVLIVDIVAAVRLVRWILAFIRTIPTGKRFLEDKIFRSRVGLRLGEAVNILFILLYLVSGIRYHSVWFVSIAFFYLVLAIGKSRLIIDEGRIRKLDGERRLAAEKRAYERTGMMLLILAVFIGGIGLQVVLEDKSYSYRWFLIFGVGAYAFYYLSLTIYNLIFFRQRHSYIWSAVQSVNFTTALLGIFTFQTALLSQFGDEASAVFFNRLTLAVLLLVLVGKGGWMVGKGKRSEQGV